jgi:hypothetical protein
MTTALRRLRYSWLVAALLITAEVGPPPTAQAPLLPFAGLRVLPQTHGQVWPADFNRDGITDLASGADDIVSEGEEFVQIALGHGDGTFRAPIVSTTIGMVRAVGDLNRDGFADVVAAHPEGLIVLGGNGDGTLQAPRRVTDHAGFDGFVQVADLNADGYRDLMLHVSTDRPNLGIFAGRAGFAFDGPVLLPLDRFAYGATTGDFDGDGRPDIAVAESAPARTPGQLSVYLNSGLLQFMRNTVAVPFGATDVTTRDLNGDGALDLLVSGADYPGPSHASNGFVYAYAGGGDGSFSLSGTYPTAIGPMSVVVGDFTRDGRLDVATGNMSGRILDNCAFVRYGADSVSILPGNADGPSHSGRRYLAPSRSSSRSIRSTRPT